MYIGFSQFTVCVQCSPPSSDVTTHNTQLIGGAASQSCVHPDSHQLMCTHSTCTSVIVLFSRVNCFLSGPPQLPVQATSTPVTYLDFMNRFVSLLCMLSLAVRFVSIVIDFEPRNPLHLYCSKCHVHIQSFLIAPVIVKC